MYFQQSRSLQLTNTELLKEIDRLDRHIKEEQQRALQLRSELRNGSRSSNVVDEVRSFDCFHFQLLTTKQTEPMRNMIRVFRLVNWSNR
jgi:hypothetical protein